MEQKTDVKFGTWIEGAFTIYKENFVVLCVAALLVVLLSILSVGILYGPMVVGLNLMVLRFVDGSEDEPKIGDVFRGFNYFVPAFVFVLVWGLIFYVVMFILSFVPCAGEVINLILSVVVPACLMFALFLIPDQKLDFWTASVKSFEMVKSNPLPFIGLSVLAGILGSVGAVLCGVGVALSLPLYALIVGQAYRDVFGTSSAAEVAGPESSTASTPSSKDAHDDDTQEPAGR